MSAKSELGDLVYNAGLQIAQNSDVQKFVKDTTKGVLKSAIDQLPVESVIPAVIGGTKAVAATVATVAASPIVIPAVIVGAVGTVLGACIVSAYNHDREHGYDYDDYYDTPLHAIDSLIY